jgi:hypothetical protein
VRTEKLFLLFKEQQNCVYIQKPGWSLQVLEGTEWALVNPALSLNTRANTARVGKACSISEGTKFFEILHRSVPADIHTAYKYNVRLTCPCTSLNTCLVKNVANESYIDHNDAFIHESTMLTL